MRDHRQGEADGLGNELDRAGALQDWARRRDAQQANAVALAEFVADDLRAEARVQDQWLVAALDVNRYDCARAEHDDIARSTSNVGVSLARRSNRSGRQPGCLPAAQRSRHGHGRRHWACAACRTVAKKAAKIRIASRKLAIGPASTMRKRWPTGLSLEAMAGEARRELEHRCAPALATSASPTNRT